MYVNGYVAAFLQGLSSSDVPTIVHDKTQIVCFVYAVRIFRIIISVHMYELITACKLPLLQIIW